MFFEFFLLYFQFLAIGLGLWYVIVIDNKNLGFFFGTLVLCLLSIKYRMFLDCSVITPSYTISSVYMSVINLCSKCFELHGAWLFVFHGY